MPGTYVVLNNGSLEGQGNEFGQICDVGVLLMENHEHLLSQVLGVRSRYT